MIGFRFRYFYCYFVILIGTAQHSRLPGYPDTDTDS
uniref:Uncharacterized protein n=1 Tax=Arundo donax TaxID=35708 RepID=A0A0A9AHF6_ARUDO